jgi:hypothetical protein
MAAAFSSETRTGTAGFVILLQLLKVFLHLPSFKQHEN